MKPDPEDLAERKRRQKARRAERKDASGRKHAALKKEPRPRRGMVVAG